MTQIFQDLNIRNCIPDFIYKLYGILMMDNYQDVISWENQNEVCIKDVKKMQTVLGNYFRHTRIDSFIRQLNMYGFNKVIKLGNKKQMYFSHPHFKKGHINEMIHIRRKKKEKNDQNQLKESEKYKQFISGNINVLYENVLELRNSNPTISQDFGKILDIIGFMMGKRTSASISQEIKVQERDYLLDNSQVCSIERQFENN